MAKKVTLRKKCGDENCQNPNCEFEIVEKKESRWKLFKQSFKNFFPVDGFTLFGSVVWILWHILCILILVSAVARSMNGGFLV